jgi:hypothetical protein
MLRILALLLFALAVSGCATPRYQTAYRYVPPEDVVGQSCLKSCEQAQTVCHADCQAAWQACTARVEPQLEARYAQALQQFAQDLRRYQLELDRYEQDLRLSWGPGHYGGMWHSPWHSTWLYPAWPTYAFSPRPPGPQPTRDSLRAVLYREKCDDGCGCPANYDVCFLGCGGRKIPETRCVANCPAEQAAP